MSETPTTEVIEEAIPTQPDIPDSASEIQKKLQQQAGLGDTPAVLPTGTKYETTDLEVKDDELIGEQDKLTEKTLTADQIDYAFDITPPQATAAQKYEAQTVDGTPEAIAAKGTLSSEAIIGDIQGQVSERAIAKAATEELDEKATVRYQLGELFKSFEEGGEPPAWASPAVRNVTAMMQSRGLGSSSMAAAAMTQAVMEAGIPIAKADADKYQQIQLTNLNNKQQAVLQNAMTFAAMDKANLDARMTAAVNNARAFLQLDITNLTNEQKTNELDYQGKLQALFKNQAADNAAAQFNAKSQNQIDTFFAQLEASVETSNANREAATAQFNINEANAMKQYTASLNNERDKFNSEMSLQVEQSNAQWRRDVNTANTAAENEANRINAQNLYNLTNASQAAVWQAYRDDISWALQYAENKEQRSHQYALLALEQSGNMDIYEQKALYDAMTELGKGLLLKWFND